MAGLFSLGCGDPPEFHIGGMAWMVVKGSHVAVATDVGWYERAEQRVRGGRAYQLCHDLSPLSVVTWPSSHPHALIRVM